MKETIMVSKYFCVRLYFKDKIIIGRPFGIRMLFKNLIIEPCLMDDNFVSCYNNIPVKLKVYNLCIKIRNK